MLCCDMFSTSVRHHQGAHLFLAKITCMTSVVIDYKTGKIHKIVRQMKYMKYINVIYTILKTLVCKIVFWCGGIYDRVGVAVVCVRCRHLTHAVQSAVWLRKVRKLYVFDWQLLKLVLLQCCVAAIKGLESVKMF